MIYNHCVLVYDEMISVCEICLCQYVCRVRGCSSLSLSPICVLECLPTGLPLSSSIWPHYGVLSPGNCRFFCCCHDEDSLMTSSLPPCASLHYGWKDLLKKSDTSPEYPPKTHTHTLVTQPRNLLSFQRVTGTNNPTMASERAGVDIHTGSIVLETERGGSGEAVLLTNP